jgi:type IV secretory pathway TrbD component
VASSKSKRSRKRRSSASVPRAVASTRRQDQADAAAAADSARRRSGRMLGADGERPPGLFGAVPVSEVAILAGLIAAVFGYVTSRPVALIIGLAICALGTMEVVGREHFTGYRAHTAMLAAIPAVAAELAVVALFGDPSQRGLLLLAIVPVYVICFFALRRQFAFARRSRVAKAARAQAPGVS